MNTILSYLHIPRTGGTTVTKSLANYKSREQPWEEHYHYSQNRSGFEYYTANLPNLAYRTREQQKKIKIFTGHGIFCKSHQWLRVPVDHNLIFTFARNPIHRILSSFNYRHSKAILVQDPNAFSQIVPQCNANAVVLAKTGDDYDTLYDWYRDANAENNLQCKWLLSAFTYYNREKGEFIEYPDFAMPEEAAKCQNFHFDDSFPDWFSVNFDSLFNKIEPFLKQLYFIAPTEKITNIMPRLCAAHNLFYQDAGRTNKPLIQKWTIDDVLNQPNINKIIENEKHDFALWEYAKNFALPF